MNKTPGMADQLTEVDVQHMNKNLYLFKCLWYQYNNISVSTILFTFTFHSH